MQYSQASRQNLIEKMITIDVASTSASYWIGYACNEMGAVTDTSGIKVGELVYK